MVSALDSGSSRLGLSPVVFLRKTCNSHSSSLHPYQVYKLVYKWVVVSVMLGVALR